jgi:hypothetical protein
LFNISGNGLDSASDLSSPESSSVDPKVAQFLRKATITVINIKCSFGKGLFGCNTQ